MDFILSPITIYAALGTSLVVCFALFLSSSMEVRRRDREHRQAMTELKEDLQEEIIALREQIQSFKTVKAIEPDEVMAAPAVAPPGSSMNLTRRAQALRLHRLGTDSAEIARRLGVAQGEVRLAVKMHKMLVETNAGA